MATPSYWVRVELDDDTQAVTITSFTSVPILGADGKPTDCVSSERAEIPAGETGELGRLLAGLVEAAKKTQTGRANRAALVHQAALLRQSASQPTDEKQLSDLIRDYLKK